ncbi:MAG: apolipoprotein N-acyltransferase [Candidatus Thiodiazotropha sp. (ex Semelilucina semeliformis)]|nr:apolipoprotein N-acyltransferase [Candidatus Thiodiazotropha sp. (ex Semelilucina semeliformis)]
MVKMSRLLEYPRLLALIAGVFTALAFAPFQFWILAVLMPAVLFFIWVRTDASCFQSGFIYGLGLMGGGVSWLYVSIAQFGDLGWLFPLVITLGFVMLAALYYGLFGWLVGHFVVSDRLRLLLVFPAMWVLIEWFRGWFLTGFPWLQLGYSQIDSPLSGYAPLLGTLGVSWAVVTTAGALILLGEKGRMRWFSITLLGVVWLSGWMLTQMNWTEPNGEPLRVALVQGNIPQAEKWAPEQLTPSLVLYAEQTKKHFDRDLIVWPETAISAFQFQVDEAFIQPLEAEVKRQGADLVFGVVQMDEAREQYFNAMVALGNAQRDDYFKQHLVPFTEYLPFKSLLWPLVDLFTIPMSDFSVGEGKPLMRVGPHLVGMSICYEDAFGSEMIQALPEAAYLINASNDAWFGRSFAPHQHLQIARMRALETGRYLLRSTNTGISAIVGPKGELLGKSPLLELDVLTGEISPMTGATPFAYTGNLIVLLIMLIVLIVAFPCGHLRFRRCRSIQRK